MIATLLRTAAVLASLVLLASFSLFAIDQAGGASQQAQAEVGSAGVQTLGPALRGAGSHGVRGTLEKVDRVLVSPVHSLAPGSPDSWAQRSFELACGLLLYGILLGVIARSTALAGRPRRSVGGPARRSDSLL